jgi:uncharacterized membrane protein YheB (UPF0754 family)
MFTKNTLPNIIALALILASFFLTEPFRAITLSTGLFALSGALTNWLAVHMLFERIPGIYGSGVISLHFEEFKAAILRMVHEELLAKDNIERLLNSKETDVDSKSSSLDGESTATTKPNKPSIADSIDIKSMLDSIDLDVAFDQLVATIVESSFGSMLAMVGGESALQPLRVPFKDKMRQFLTDTANSPRVRALVSEQVRKAASSEVFIQKLDQLLRARLDELTPEMVKQIMQRMIKKHLGWLVIWGGVFGGVIGLLTGVITTLV